jgi:hypothetical protein
MISQNNSRKTSTPVLAKPRVSKSTRLLDQLREHIRDLHYSLRTEEAYLSGEENSFIFITSGIRATRCGAGGWFRSVR